VNNRAQAVAWCMQNGSLDNVSIKAIDQVTTLNKVVFPSAWTRRAER
jgi:hypothetical protein